MIHCNTDCVFFQLLTTKPKIIKNVDVKVLLYLFIKMIQRVPRLQAFAGDT